MENEKSSKVPPEYTAEADPPPAWTPTQNYYQQEMVAPSQPVVTVASNPPVGPKPIRLTCPSCRADVLSDMKHEPTTKTHLMALLLFCFFCWPCVCLPYCMDSCQNANHYCPNCNAFIGTYQS
ncbi:lipopolysaccharide-induced tumor necrosis factor-alpha factor homolog isoform X4 [Episyrphus balteatus]|uniref:lipopolysaccharide-induced tumor necrosis factor-alpha factor homolog isoform X4 n=1 Tax=Episyrphus balteatus TaxID=286459 RepID=UPI0024867AF4|nr:lipopolysaccharide-induced tumor necrosis factor-alpha factor homolog isoform X4 [Episyrphus balteatus]